jgi:hypothetical protein
MCTTASRSPLVRIAAEVSAKARLQRWFSLAGGLLLLLITTLGVVWALVALAHIALVAF